MIFVLILYMFQVPLYVSYEEVISARHLNTLLVFDFLFMLSRFLDLFIGFRNKDGQMEPKVSFVICKNLSITFFLEIIYTFGPFFMNINNLNSMYYFFFKFPRFNNLFEVSNTINNTLDYYCKSWTVTEIKNTV